MAIVLECERLVALLGEAVSRGAPLVWLAAGDLHVGASPGTPTFRVDLAGETLVPYREVRTRRPPAGSSGRGSANPGKPAEPRNARDEGPERSATPQAGRPPASRRTGSFSVILDGTHIPATSQKALLLVALQALERAKPGTLERLAAERGRTKRVVARQREDLYDDPRLGERFSQSIEGGWWVATNNSFPETEKFIRRAAFHAGCEVELQRSA